MSVRAVILPLIVNVALVAPTVNMVLNITPTPLAVSVTLKVPDVPVMNVSPLTVAVVLKPPTVVLV